MADKQDVQNLQGFDSFEEKLGDLLRGERATLSKSLLDVQRDLRIKAAYIAAIENCDLDVFENRAFIAGYVRSYARYLQLDSEEIFSRFCMEADFQGANPELGRRRDGKSSIGATSALWAGNDIGRIRAIQGRMVTQNVYAPALAALGPLLVLLAVIVGVGYGGWMMVQDIQRVDIAPIDNTPEVLDQIDSSNFASSLANIALDRADEHVADITRLYTSTNTNAPFVVPRDGPIAFIDPDSYGTVVNVPQTANTVASAEAVQPPEPVINVAPVVQVTGIYAQAPAWIRVTAANGTVLRETILDAGESYALPDGYESATLRAGNATAVFLLVDGVAYGPVGTAGAVVKNVALAAGEIPALYPEFGNPTAEMQRALVALASAGTDAAN
ncbi:MAG: RodZ domain-containing protein [Paracoccaceae bacterium]